MISKVNILKAKILKEIDTGKLNSGDSLPSRHQYMRRYNFSRGTVDAAINALGREGFVYSRQGGGTYVAEKRAGSVISQISIVDRSDISTIIDSGLQSGKLAGRCQFSIPCSIYPEDEVYVNLDKLSLPGNSVVWVRPSYKYYMAMCYLADAGIPQLLIGRNYGNIDFVTTDAKAGIMDGMALLKEKCSGVAFVSERNNPDIPYIAERQIAFYQSCVELELNIRKEFIFDFDSNFFSSEVTRIGNELFLSENPPDAIFFANFSIAVPLITFAEANGKVPGQDFEILLFDDDPRLAGKKGVYMLSQQWKAMAEVVMEWLSAKNADINKVFNKKIKPELLGGKS